MLDKFIFGNESLLAILLASLLIFYFVCVTQKWEQYRVEERAIYLVLALFAVCILLFTNGRASIIGLAAGGLFVVAKNFRLRTRPRALPWIIIVLSILLLFFLYSVKKDSSEGRLLIYKISANIFKDNWIWGVGIGQFKKEYNSYQADYFAEHDIDSKEALIADNTFYAFNDVWQFLIEIGAVKFIILLIAGLFLVKHFKQYKIRNDKECLFYAGASSILCIAVASLFSYPFHVISIQLFSIVCLIMILKAIETTKPLSKLFLFSAKVVCYASFLLLSFYGYKKIQLRQKSKEAFELSQAGFKTKALDAFGSIHNSLFQEGSSKYMYGKQLYSSNRLTEAKKVLDETKKGYTDNEVYKLSASIAYELEDFRAAEKDYLTAMYMVPNRMGSRYELYNFYLNRKDTAKAIYWARSIVSMPVKISSARTDAWLKKVKENLPNLQRFR